MANLEYDISKCWHRLKTPFLPLSLTMSSTAGALKKTGPVYHSRASVIFLLQAPLLSQVPNYTWLIVSMRKCIIFIYCIQFSSFTLTKASPYINNYQWLYQICFKETSSELCKFRNVISYKFIGLVHELTYFFKHETKGKRCYTDNEVCWSSLSIIYLSGSEGTFFKNYRYP